MDNAERLEAARKMLPFWWEAFGKGGVKKAAEGLQVTLQLDQEFATQMAELMIYLRKALPENLTVILALYKESLSPVEKKRLCLAARNCRRLAWSHFIHAMMFGMLEICRGHFGRPDAQEVAELAADLERDNPWGNENPVKL